jgi:hypothetical protein
MRLAQKLEPGLLRAQAQLMWQALRWLQAQQRHLP